MPLAVPVKVRAEEEDENRHRADERAELIVEEADVEDAGEVKCGDDDERDERDDKAVTCCCCCDPGLAAAQRDGTSNGALSISDLLEGSNDSLVSTLAVSTLAFANTSVKGDMAWYPISS